jgi:enoyl-CoA hydratase/carnithine racemase
MVTNMVDSLDDNSEVLITSSGPLAIITLNRPKALNALSHQMIKIIYNNLLIWQNDDNIKAVVIRSNNERAFCAGGDIKSLFTHGRTNPLVCMEFFKDEYKLNTLIYDYNKPYISLLQGITMGGGLGISIHGSRRIAASNLVLAMPETGIGFFPDIGASYFLSRCKNYTGIYLGLTGAKINAIDAKYLDLVTDIITAQDYSHAFGQIINLLQHSPLQPLDLTKFSDNSIDNPSHIQNLNIENINNYFKYNTVAEIFLNLEKDQNNNPWAKETLSLLKLKSPTSLILTFELLKRGAECSFEQCMQLEYGLAYGFLQHNDLYEGIRAVLVDKDNKPNWDKLDINNISNFPYEKYFIDSMAKSLYL